MTDYAELLINARQFLIQSEESFLKNNHMDAYHHAMQAFLEIEKILDCCLEKSKEQSMRKGWKTRIDERRYFEEKKEQQEELAMMHKFMQQKMEHDIQVRLQEMRGNNEIN